jgi:hypothetical protein
MPNQNPEQIARDHIDKQLVPKIAAGRNIKTGYFEEDV